MQVLTAQDGINEGAAETKIFDACRANEARLNTPEVAFARMAGDEYLATLTENGVVVMVAIVDKFDC